MRTAILLCFSAALLSAQYNSSTGLPAPVIDPKNLGTVEGKVLHGIGGQPIGNVEVSMRLVGGVVGLTLFNTTTDGEGTFRFERVPPGRYALEASKNGFSSQYWGAKHDRTGAQVTVAEGAHVTGIDFRLMPHAVITGKVTDEDGDPIAGVSVQALQPGYRVLEMDVYGGRVLRPTLQGSYQPPNDLGEYRLANLPAGEYYLQAVIRRRLPAPVPPPSEAGKPEEQYVDLYYPGSLQAAGASPVNAPPGAEVRGIDIKLRKVPVFRVRGTIRNCAGQRCTVSLMSTDRPGEQPGTVAAALIQNPRGEFELTGIVPGSYNIVASNSVALPQGSASYAVQPINITDRSIDGVGLSLTPATDVRGSVIVEQPDSEKAQGASPAGMSVSVASSDGSGLFETSAMVQADGSFTLRNIFPGTYQIATNRIPKESYIKEIRVNGQASPDNRVSLDARTRLDVAMGFDGAVLNAVAVDAKGNPVTGATVTIIPQGRLEDRPDISFGANSDQNGMIQTRGIVPGEYKVFCWEDHIAGEARDPNFWGPFAAKAPSVTFQPGESQTVKVTMVTVEEIAQARARR